MERRRRRKGLSEQIVEHSKREVPQREKKEINEKDLIPSGSTLLNCACSDNPWGAYGVGKIVTLPGGSASGKTILKLTMFAEMNKLKRFNDYLFIYDDVEEALEFDIPYLFGKKTADRIQAPDYDSEEKPIYSETIQDFQNYILIRIKQGEPFVYVLDSLDALTSSEELEKEYKKALLSAKSDKQVEELKGSYKTEKAKIIGQVLRMINGRIRETRSALIIVQQERDKIGVVFGSKKTTSGGRAPFYYSTHQVWLNKIGNLKPKSKDRNEKIGTRVKAEVKKNKLTGKLREVEFDIYGADYGIDDVGSCVEFLCKEHWKSVGRKWEAEEFGIVGDRKSLVEQIEKEGLESELIILVGETWKQIEESLRLRRKPRYA